LVDSKELIIMLWSGLVEQKDVFKHAKLSDDSTKTGGCSKVML